MKTGTLETGTGSDGHTHDGCFGQPKVADTNCEDLEKAVATNVLGPFRLTKALLARGVVSGGSRGSSSPGDQYLQRCGSDALSKMGSLRRQQGRPPPPDRNLESGIIGRGRTVSLF